LLGVAVQPDSSTSGNDPYTNGSSSSTPGATVDSVQSGSGAARAGITQGDVITGIDGKNIDSAAALTHAMSSYSPNDNVQVTWTDSSGAAHHASVHLGSGPPA
jgi:S1-C subfamily serine protease